MRALILGAAFFLAANAPRSDTAQLALHLRAVRAYKALPSGYYSPIRAEYLAWIDSRVKARESLADMRAELQAAGILAKPASEPTTEMYRSYVGYVEPPGESQIRGGEDVFAIEAAVYRNASCGLDATEILYDKKTLDRLGWVNGELSKSDYPFYNSSPAVGEQDASGARVVASGWVISNCTSTWNGKSIRIDRLDRNSNVNLLSRGISAHDRDGTSVATWVRGDTVTFFYSGGLQDLDLLETPSIARYRIAGGRAIHESPIALTRAGFINEWLTLKDVNPSDYATAEAVAVRAKTDLALRKGISQWQSVARCPGAPPVLEIAIRVDKPPQNIVFRISGERASQLRMVGIAAKLTPGCNPIGVSNGLETISAELPW